MKLVSEVPAATVPPNETGMSTENRLPKARDAVPRYHDAKNEEASIEN
jgi:hypothetical protein